MPDAGKYGLIEVPITTTNAINATGTGVFVEFWVATSNLVAGNGWALQLSPDGANWNTRLSETTGRNHAYALYHYDLDASERVSTRKMRFHFAGNGPANPASDINLDDIKVASISNAAPSPLTTAQTYHPLIIPDVITGTTFNLAVNEKTKQFRTGTATNTNAYNNMLFGGPTLIMNKGDWVQMNVTNNLSVDTTPVHWHGFHIPAIMDGGPHQTIPAGTPWSPSWTVMNTSLGTPLANSYPGGEPSTGGQFGSLINNLDFNILHINVVAPTANPITSVPSPLASNTYWTTNDITNPTTRTLNITGGAPGLVYFNTDQLYSPTVCNQTVNLNAVEKWTITNTSGFSHSFHIHDIQFNLISRVSAGAGPASVTGIASYEQGWKDTLYVQRNSSVTFITKFDHFASNANPFMYHCHFANHKDEGLMGQFAVINNTVEDLAIASFTRTGNKSFISLDFKATPGTTYTLQSSLDMSAWTEIGSVTSDGTTVSFTETDATRLGRARGFYRVMIPAVP